MLLMFRKHFNQHFVKQFTPAFISNDNVFVKIFRLATKLGKYIITKANQFIEVKI